MKESHKEGTRLSKIIISAPYNNHIGINILFRIKCVGNPWFRIARANESLPN